MNIEIFHKKSLAVTILIIAVKNEGIRLFALTKKFDLFVSGSPGKPEEIMSMSRYAGSSSVRIVRG